MDSKEHQPWQHFWNSTLDAVTGVAGSAESLQHWPHQWMAQSAQATQAWWEWWLQSFSPTQLNWKLPGPNEFQHELARHSTEHEPVPRGEGKVHSDPRLHTGLPKAHSRHARQP